MSINFEQTKKYFFCPAIMKSVLVHNLTPNVNRKHLEEIFGEYGTISQILLSGPLFKPMLSGISRLQQRSITNGSYQMSEHLGSCLLQFSSAYEAKQCVEYMHGGQIDGQIIRCQLHDDVELSKQLPMDQQPSSARFDRERFDNRQVRSRDSSAERFARERPQLGHQEYPGSFGPRYRNRSPSPRSRNIRPHFDDRRQYDSDRRPAEYLPPPPPPPPNAEYPGSFPPPPPPPATASGPLREYRDDRRRSGERGYPASRGGYRTDSRDDRYSSNRDRRDSRDRPRY